MTRNRTENLQSSLQLAKGVLESVEGAIMAKRPDQRAALSAWFLRNQPLLNLIASNLASSELDGQNPEAFALQRLSLVEAAILAKVPSPDPVQAWFEQMHPLLKLLSTSIIMRLREQDRIEVAEVLDAPELWSAKDRTEANLRAITILVELLRQGRRAGIEEQRLLARYSGWGGLSIDAIVDRLPKEWLPELQGLVNEYYTPRLLCKEVARVVKPLLPAFDSPKLRALEPSAGIGRFIQAFSGPGFESLSWTAVEYSRISASLLQALRPDIIVFQGPFEQWIADNEADVSGSLGLVVSNPPYGKRGGTVRLDKDASYREENASPYFLRRGLDLLRQDGIGVFLIPYGFLSSKSPRFVELRRKVLLRHHLIVAFRLPSTLFPGANIVVDLLFFRARGGELPDVLPEDVSILRGNYFADTPAHILGKVIGQEDTDDPDRTTKRARFGFEIVGEFTRLPPFVQRLQCSTCRLEPIRRPARAPSPQPKMEDLPPYLQAAVTLGERVAIFLKFYGAQDQESAKAAAVLFPELRDALDAWQHGREQDNAPRSPYQDRALQGAARFFAALVSFLSAFEQDGEPASAFRTAPVYTPRYTGARDDIQAQALFLYQTRRRVTLSDLEALRADIGAKPASSLDRWLISAGWCLDEDAFYPESDYFVGALWPKYRRAKALLDKSQTGLVVEAAQRQANRLYDLIDPPPFSEINAEPRMPWIPADVMQAWLSDWADPVAALSWQDGLLRLAGKPLGDIEKLSKRLQAAFGYLNHDYGLFQLDYTKQYLEDQKREETAAEALDRVRLEYAKNAVIHFSNFVTARPEVQRDVETAYAALFKGYITPQYEPRDLELLRWRGQFSLRPHQRAGAWRLISNGGGLLAFDVGVGKTLTGIAVAARMRQEGHARRILIIVPNSILWKWDKEIHRALPDYRVGVIGAERYKGRQGDLRSRIDTPQERALKYRMFQAGEFDIALVSFSMFSRTVLQESTLKRFVEATPTLQRVLGLRARSELADFEKGEAKGKKKKKAAPSLAAVRRIFGDEAIDAADEKAVARMRLEAGEQLSKQEEARLERLRDILGRFQNASERERAVFALKVDEWVAEQRDLKDQDPGITWEDLKVDLLIVDEAQNMKNLWPVEQREGGIPKYLGAIQEGSQRAWQFALRAFEVRERNNGTGVVELSATPAKNSPLEYFTLLGYVDGDAWTRLGITDPEVFIDRYLRLELRQTVEPDLSTKLRSVVVGFKNLNELRDIVFRYADFKTAEQVGLKLPEVEVQNVVVPMDGVQRSRFNALATEYRDTLNKASVLGDSGGGSARMKALGLLQRMALVSVHPELDTTGREADKDFAASPDPEEAEAPEEGQSIRQSGDKKKHFRWTWQNARLVKNPSSPKLAAAVRLVLMQRDCGHIIFCDNVAVHFWLRTLLVQAGIPAERIGVLNAEVAKTPLSRQVIAEKFNGIPTIYNDKGEVELQGQPPELDVVLANATAYEGIDLQVRTCQVIHLDLPWEPATLQQRNGRAVRQGNMRAVIRIVYVLAERSTDAVRQSVITGKLGWMKDILESADRETNNPAAQQEMSAEEMMLYLSSDPESAKAAVELMKREQAERNRQSTVKSAWNALRTLASRLAALSRAVDPDELAYTHKSIADAKAALSRFPAEVWPWAFLIELAEKMPIPFGSGRPPLVFGETSKGGTPFALWEGARFLRGSSGEGFEIGRIEGDTLGLRRLGGFAWNPVLISSLPRDLDEWLSEATPADFQAPWPEAADRQAYDQGFRAAIETLYDAELGPIFGLRWATEAWRIATWQAYGKQVVEALSHLGTEVTVPMETENTGDKGPLYTLDVISGSWLRDEQRFRVIPWTSEGFDRFVNLSEGAIGTTSLAGTKLTWTVLDGSAQYWWGRRLPRRRATAVEGDSSDEATK
jgi:hypothetical protein